MLLKNKIITVDIFYFMPDHSNLLQEFVWQTSDIVPEMIRVHKFLNYWHKNIDAVISEILISVDNLPYREIRSIDSFIKV